MRPPVLFFTHPACPSAPALEARLRVHGVAYTVVALDGPGAPAPDEAPPGHACGYVSPTVRLPGELLIQPTPDGLEAALERQGLLARRGALRQLRQPVAA